MKRVIKFLDAFKKKPEKPKPKHQVWSVLWEPVKRGIQSPKTAKRMQRICNDYFDRRGTKLVITHVDPRTVESIMQKYKANTNKTIALQLMSIALTKYGMPASSSGTLARLVIERRINTGQIEYIRKFVDPEFVKKVCNAYNRGLINKKELVEKLLSEEHHQKWLQRHGKRQTLYSELRKRMPLAETPEAKQMRKEIQEFVRKFPLERMKGTPGLTEIWETRVSTARFYTLVKLLNRDWKFVGKPTRDAVLEHVLPNNIRVRVTVNRFGKVNVVEILDSKKRTVPIPETLRKRLNEQINNMELPHITHRMVANPELWALARNEREFRVITNLTTNKWARISQRGKNPIYTKLIGNATVTVEIRENGLPRLRKIILPHQTIEVSKEQAYIFTDSLMRGRLSKRALEKEFKIKL